MKTELLDIRNMDCMELMAEFPDNHFDLAVVDPPYGIGDFVQSQSKKIHKKVTWNNSAPSLDYFEELERVSKNRIIWGANYYNLKDKGRIIHDKTDWGRRNQPKELSDADIASHSFGVNIKIFRFLWCGNVSPAGINKIIKIHPCQKPTELYDWILANYAEKGMKILDTHLGSMSSAIACHYAGMHLTGCELDEDYYKAGCERVQRETRQLTFL